MHLPRFRVRTMMVVVATVAIVLGAKVGLMRRADHFHQLAEYHKYQAMRYVLNDPHGNWHWDMARKYRSAKKRPYLPVAPDQPKPK